MLIINAFVRLYEESEKRIRARDSGRDRLDIKQKKKDNTAVIATGFNGHPSPRLW